MLRVAYFRTSFVSLEQLEIQSSYDSDNKVYKSPAAHTFSMCKQLFRTSQSPLSIFFNKELTCPMWTTDQLVFPKHGKFLWLVSSCLECPIFWNMTNRTGHSILKPHHSKTASLPLSWCCPLHTQVRKGFFLQPCPNSLHWLQCVTFLKCFLMIFPLKSLTYMYNPYLPGLNVVC